MIKTLRYEEHCTVHLDGDNICLKNDKNLPFIERCFIHIDKWKQVKAFVDKQIKKEILIVSSLRYHEFYIIYKELTHLHFRNESYQIYTETCKIPIDKWEQVKQFIDAQIKTKNNGIK